MSRRTPQLQAHIGLALDRLDARRHHIFGIWLEGLVRNLLPLAPRLSVVRGRRPNRPMTFEGVAEHRLPSVLSSHYAYATLGPRYFDRIGLDLVHFPFLYAPYSWAGTRVARVVTIHGSARNEMPYDMRKPFGTGKHDRMIRSLGDFDAILAVSESARREASEFYRIPAERIRVVHDAIGDQFRPGEPAVDVLERYGIRRPYVLSLCTLRPKKNVGTTVAAFAELKRRGLAHQLVIVGDKALLDQAVAFIGYAFAPAARAGGARLVLVVLLCARRGSDGGNHARVDLFLVVASVRQRHSASP